jgi:hypothetical protein
LKRRRTSFATPFVVTAACGATPAPANPPALTPAEHLVPIDPVLHDPPDEQPSNPPPSMTEGALVVQPHSGSSCYLVYEREMRGRTSRSVFDEGEVPCPPNVKLPADQYVTIGRERYHLDTESLKCYREVRGNPPSWRESACPDSLLPELVGLVPDENCMYRGVRVKAPSCPPKPPPRTIRSARIIHIAVVGASIEVTIGAGTDQGIEAGMTIRLERAGIAKITSCSAQTCKTTVNATEDQVRASSGSVVFE